jgi:hypothetical protein
LRSIAFCTGAACCVVAAVILAFCCGAACCVYRRRKDEPVAEANGRVEVKQ